MKKPVSKQRRSLLQAIAIIPAGAYHMPTLRGTDPATIPIRVAA